MKEACNRRLIYFIIVLNVAHILQFPTNYDWTLFGYVSCVLRSFFLERPAITRRERAPCLAIKFLPHIIRESIIKFHEKKEKVWGAIIYSSSSRESRCKRGRYYETSSQERGRKMSPGESEPPSTFFYSSTGFN